LSTDRIRLFVAAEIPDDRLRALDELVTPLRSKLTNARWTDVANQHLTLKFLGNTPADHLEAIEQTCSMVAAGCNNGELRFTELGAFPSRARIRVLWMGVRDDDDVLTRAAKDLGSAFETLGFASEARDYAPHLTLARFKLPVPLKSGFPEIDASSVDGFSFDALTLYRSHLSPKGARYEVVKRFPLGSKR
jgi:RNA 2',3'-cyclic 3'-phosphodiesterase